jgi:hypothetical protein
MRIGQRRCWELRTPLFPERSSLGAHARISASLVQAHIRITNWAVLGVKCGRILNLLVIINNRSSFCRREIREFQKIAVSMLTGFAAERIRLHQIESEMPENLWTRL